MNFTVQLHCDSGLGPGNSKGCKAAIDSAKWPSLESAIKNAFRWARIYKWKISRKHQTALCPACAKRKTP